MGTEAQWEMDIDKGQVELAYMTGDLWDVLEVLAHELDKIADNENKKIAYIAGIPYDSTRRDSSNALGIRRSADRIRELIPAEHAS